MLDPPLPALVLQDLQPRAVRASRRGFASLCAPSPPKNHSRQREGLGPALQRPGAAVLLRIGLESVADGYVGAGNTTCLLRLLVLRCSAKYLKLWSREAVNLNDLFFFPSLPLFFFFILMELGVRVLTTSTTEFCHS